MHSFHYEQRQDFFIYFFYLSLSSFFLPIYENKIKISSLSRFHMHSFDYYLLHYEQRQKLNTPLSQFTWLSRIPTRYETISKQNPAVGFLKASSSLLLFSSRLKNKFLPYNVNNNSPFPLSHSLSLSLLPKQIRNP